MTDKEFEDTVRVYYRPTESALGIDIAEYEEAFVPSPIQGVDFIIVLSRKDNGALAFFNAKYVVRVDERMPTRRPPVPVAKKVVPTQG